MPLKVAFYLGLFLLTHQSCLALTIVPENMDITFPGIYLSGRGQNAVSNPTHSQLYVVRFYVDGEPGRKITVTVPNNQYLNHDKSSRKIKVRRIFYGCGLSKRGRAKINSNGRSKLLCIGAKIRIGAKFPAGSYSGTIPFEVNYR
ncbi:DUF4402 domain-containing protein [Vibrio sp. V1B]|uniref:DUF4402 domain-containing protein n=1 Tax=Vibrio harveyi group TaxID=717610 RepID=UPI0009DC3FF3|nr:MULTISPECIES: DUF4402 domain-containing protein [Vibrio harveyi group]PAW09795.1 DUF4402 domain-containing protein [Vibrio sp. V1B]